MISPGIDRDRITPEWLTKLTEPIEALYTALQRDLIVNIARQFNVFGRKANIPTSYAWRGYMLGQLGGLTKENYDTIARYSGDISEATRLAVQTSVEASVGVVDRAFMEEVLDPDYAPEITETTERVTGYYVNQALEKQNLVNTVMLNSTRRYYEQTVGATSDALDQSLDAAQQALNAAAGGVIHGTTDFYSALRDCVRDMADHGLTGFYDKAGREWSAQAYVTMDMRTTAANAAREAAMERNREYGNELIAVSSHPGARPLCEPYQGGVYSTDGSTGETTDVHGASISYYPLELTSYGEAAGLFGINCGHYPSPFIPGLSVVRKLDISHEENERLYKESQHQRYMERRVRAAKIEADALKAAGDAEGAKAARAKARERNAELKAWCKERERAYYPERVRVTRAASGPLTNGPRNGIISEKEESRKTRGENYSVNWSAVQSAGYSRKFDALSSNETANRAVRTRAIWALNNRDGKNTEELYAVDMTSGKEIARITDQQYEFAVKRTGSFSTDLQIAESRGCSIMMIHNHPRGMPPSIGDINTLLETPGAAGITAGHDGSVYYYTAPNRQIEQSDYDIAMMKYKRFSEVTNIEKALEELAERYGFSWRKL